MHDSEQWQRDSQAEGDVLHDECGVFGVWAPGRDVARLTYFGVVDNVTYVILGYR